jgi:hypothetical protein
MATSELVAPSIEALRFVLDWFQEHGEAEEWPAENVRDAARILEAYQAKAWRPIETAPPIQRFICGQGWQPSKPPYVLAVDAKGRMSVGYARENSEGFMWVFAKPIGQPVYWMPLPAPPAQAGCRLIR